MDSNNNKKEVNKHIFIFICYFIVLVFFSFLSLFFFIKSYTIQCENIEKDIASYKSILNKQQVLKGKIDTIYEQMALFNTDKIRNNLFLGNYISNNIKKTRDIIGADSISEFKHYAFLLDKMDSILTQKTEIKKISDKENLVLRDLTQCIGKFSKIKVELFKDPTRGFQ